MFQVMRMAEIIELHGKKYALDQNGYLTEMSQWDSQIMDWFADQANIAITDEHYKVMEYLREYYEIHKKHPGMRVLFAALPEIFGREKGTLTYFHELFPGGCNQAYKIAGLPVQHSCC